MAHEFTGSDWGDWLPRAVAAADPDGVDIWYLGCNGFVLKADDGTTLFVDPYCGGGDPPRTVRMLPVPFDPTDIGRCEAVLATHEHSDHVHGPTQAPLLAHTDATYHAPDDSLAVVDDEAWTAEYDLDESRFVEIAEGETFGVGPFSVHVEGANDPDAAHPVSYVIDHEAGTFLHGGDARPGEPFERVGREYDIDLAALAFGSSGYLPDGDGGRSLTRWYSDENELALAAEQVGADRLVPTHWDIWRGLTADPAAVRPHVRSFASPRSVEIVEIGDWLSL